MNSRENMMTSERLTGLARLAFKNRASQVYLALVAAATVFVTVDTLFVHHADASIAGVWLFFLAAPTVFLFLIGGGAIGEGFVASAGFLYPALVVSVLVQAVAIGPFVRLLRHRPAPATGRPREA
ncbi:SCO4225 family membrane protein [Streptomyces sp. NPDC059092]|uniref:SCO4225 family membrane protein n=1 Tax=Streptomyces sp. NPDC059092 TaxID=3346725 RepID=UPI0036B1B2A6